MAAVRQVMAHLPANGLVMRTDVKSFYACIDHIALMDRLARQIDDRSILNLPGQYMRRTAERGGGFHDHERGISLGCPLSWFLRQRGGRCAVPPTRSMRCWARCGWKSTLTRRLSER